MPEGPDPAAYRPGGWSRFWNTVLVLDLLVLAANVVFAAVLFVRGDSGEVAFTKTALYAEVLTTFALVGILPFLWLWGTRQGGLPGALRYLNLTRDLARAGVLSGALWGLGLLGIVIAVSAVLALIGGAPEESGVVTALLDVVDWPLVLLVALTAGVGEEILYRGILQRWIGVWGQGIVFGLSHAGYGTVANVVAPFAIGLLLGYLYKRRPNLYLVMTAHFLYDFLLLAIGRFAA